MHVVLLHNEKAGDEDWTGKELIKLVRDIGFRVKYYDIDEAMARPRVMDGAEFVIAAGGDGTIRKAALKLIGRGPALAPLPLGTANNIAQSLGLRQKPEKIVAGWEKPRRRKFDIGIARGTWGVRRFVEGIGLGLISRMIAVLTDIDDVSVHEWKRAKHKLHRDACVAAALAHEMPALPAELAIDGHDRSNEFLLLEILNIRRAGPAVELAAQAAHADGKLDVVTVTARQRRRLMATLKDRLADKKPRALTTRRAKTVRFAPAIDCELRIDDGNLPLKAGENVEVGVESGALEVVVPG
jgi:diacylglycerol kinase family enzyme